MTIRGERRLPLIVAVVIAAFFASLVVRGHFVDSKADRYCRVLRTLIVESGRPPSSAPAYYRANPEELAGDQAQYDRALSLLDCKTLPTEGTP